MWQKGHHPGDFKPWPSDLPPRWVGHDSPIERVTFSPSQKRSRSWIARMMNRDFFCFVLPKKEWRRTKTAPTKWVFPKIGGKPPKWMVKIRETNPYEQMDEFGGVFSPPYFWFNTQISQLQNTVNIEFSPCNETKVLTARWKYTLQGPFGPQFPISQCRAWAAFLGQGGKLFFITKKNVAKRIYAKIFDEPLE